MRSQERTPTSFLEDTQCSDKPCAPNCSAQGESGSARPYEMKRLGQYSPFDDQRTSAVNWASLQQIYPTLSLYGGPSCIFSTPLYLLVGTEKGSVLIYNHKQFLQVTLVPQATAFQSSVSLIRISDDGTYIVVAYYSGDVFIWDLNRAPEHPSNHVISILHINHHQGYTINGLGFLPERHTGVVISDTRGQVWLHRGSRGKLWQLTCKSKSLLNINSMKSQLLASEPSPRLSEYPDLQLVAVLCHDSLTIISVNPILATQWFHSVRLNETVSSGVVSWSPEASSLAYALGPNVHNIRIEGFTRDRVIVSKDHPWSWTGAETVVMVQWLALDTLCVLSSAGMLTVLNTTMDVPVLMSIDLSAQGLVGPSQRYLTCLDKQIFFLTKYLVKHGKFLSWTDLLLQYVQTGNYCGAHKAIGYLVAHGSGIAPLVQLSDDSEERKSQLTQPFRNLSLASLKFLMNQETVEYAKFYDLFSLIIEVGSLFEKSMTQILEDIFELLNNTHIDAFYDALSNQILEGTPFSLPPFLLKEVLQYYAETKNLKMIELLIVTLNQSSLDIDMAVKICRKFNLYGVLMHLWNNIFDDYLTPLVDIICKLTKQDGRCTILDKDDPNPSFDIYDYLSCVLSGIQYPVRTATGAETSLKAKDQIYSFLCSGTALAWPSDSKDKLLTNSDPDLEPAYPYLQVLLRHDPKKCLSMLYKVFDDPFLNEDRLEDTDSSSHQLQVSRQFLVDVLLELLKTSNDVYLRVLIAVFITRVVPKFPQFITVSHATLDELVSMLCTSNINELKNECEQSLECLFASYKPSNMDELIIYLRDCGFDKVLFFVYKNIPRPADYLRLRIVSRDLQQSAYTILDVMSESIGFTTPGAPEREAVIKVIRENINTILISEQVDAIVTVLVNLEDGVEEILNQITSSENKKRFMEKIFDLRRTGAVDPELQHLYIQLCCEQRDFAVLRKWLKRTDFSRLDVSRVIKILEEFNDRESIILVYMKLDSYVDALNVSDSAFIDALAEQDFEQAETFVQLGVIICENAADAATECWTRLLVSIIKNYSFLAEGGNRTEHDLLQHVILRLSLWETTKSKQNTSPFGDILVNVLSKQDITGTKIHLIREVIINLLKAHIVDENIQQLIMKIVDNSAGTVINEYIEKLQSGWSISNYECEVCGRRIWGVGIATQEFLDWKSAELLNDKESAYVSSSMGLILFRCRHGFHERCLRNMGQSQDSFSCLACYEDK
ncbi:AaceriAFR002Cp [[Ashbya] aceris (nom. inval.)]|nr:AaceriAFR002Cp [[Ashbya] aceris (nom. inval.)]